MDLRATLGNAVASARDSVENLGHVGVAGLALIAFTIAFALGGLAPLREEVQGLRSRLDRLSHLPAKSTDGSAAATQPVLRDIALPSATEALPQVMRLSDLAEKQGLKLRQGDYRLHRDREAGVVAYQMHYPVSGAYAALREFINRALEEFPALALEEVQIRRNSIGATDVEARLRFTLYLREK